MEWMTTGRTMGFDEALQAGLVHHVYDSKNFWPSVMEYARQFVPPGKAAAAVGRIKRSVVTGAELPLAEALALERELQQLLFETEDAKEGITAYVEKRPPVFKGK